MEKSHEYWMQHALTLAKRAEAEGEVPVGAVLVKDDLVIGEGWNRPIIQQDTSAHAEIQALRNAGEKQDNYRFPGSTLYVTLEPCLMCAGAIMHARVTNLVFGAFDPKSGVAGSVLNVFTDPKLNFHCTVSSGVMTEECVKLLQDFFGKRREEKKKRKLC